MLKKFNNPPIFSLAETKSVWITKCRPLIKFIQWFRFIQSVFILSLSCLSVIFLLYFLFQIWNNFFYRSLLHYDTKPSSLSLSLNANLSSSSLYLISSPPLLKRALHLCRHHLLICLRQQQTEPWRSEAMLLYFVTALLYDASSPPLPLSVKSMSRDLSSSVRRLSPPWSVSRDVSLPLCTAFLPSSAPPNLFSPTTSRRWLLLCNKPRSRSRWRQLCFSSKLPWRLVGEQPN